MARHVRKGDLVIVTSGSLKGETGTIMRVVTGHTPNEDRVIIKGLNLRTKHLKPNRLNTQGGIITREAPIHISNVSPVVDGKPTRVRFLTKPDGSKVRVAVRGGQELGVIRSATAKTHQPSAERPAGGKKTKTKPKAAKA